MMNVIFYKYDLCHCSSHAITQKCTIRDPSSSSTHFSCLPNVMLCLHFNLITVKQERKICNLVFIKVENEGLEEDLVSKSDILYLFFLFQP